jgi:hypothetical protein
LVRGRDADELRPRRGLLSGAQRQSFTVHLDRHQFGAGRDQGTAQSGVAGILQPDTIAGIEQKAGHDRQRLANAGHDDDLLCRAIDAARRGEVVGDRRTQRRMAGRTLAQQQAARWHAPTLRQQARPQPEGEAGTVRLPRPQQSRRRDRAVGGRDQERHPLREDWPAAAPRRIARQTQRCSVRELLRDIGAGPMPGFHIAFAHQLLQGQQHGVAGDAEFVRQHPARRHARARPQAARQNQLHEFAVDLAMQRLMPRAIDVNRN